MSVEPNLETIDKHIRALGGMNPSDAVAKLTRLGEAALFRMLEFRRRKVKIDFPDIGGRDKEEALLWATYSIAAAHPDAAEQAILQGHVDAAAFFAMRSAVGDRANQLLHVGLRSKQAEVRFHAACGLAEQGGLEAATALSRLIADRSPKVRQIAVETVAAHGDETVVPTLKNVIASRSNLKYRSLLDAAANGIFRLTGEKVDIPEMPTPEPEPTPERKPPLAKQLPPPPSHETLKPIDALIVDLGDFDLINETSQKLSEFGPEALYRVLGVLDGSTPVSPSGHWRDVHEGLGTAIHTLAARYPSEYLAIANTSNRYGDDWLNDSLYVSGLGAIEAHEAVPLLLRATRSSLDTVRHAAARALAWRDDESLILHFENLLEYEDPGMRTTAVDGLSRIGGKRELAIIKKEVAKQRNHEYPLVRQFMQNSVDDMAARLNEAKEK